MLRTFGPECDGSLIDGDHDAIAPGATWIDLEEPTKDEEQLVEQFLGINIPTHEELQEIEPSSRLYERNGALFMTLSALRGIEEKQPASTPIGFVLMDNRLVTIRYATPKPVLSFIGHVRREPELARDALTVLARLLDAIVDRLADELEVLGDELDKISGHVFQKTGGERRIPAARLTALLNRIGHAQSLLAKIRYTAVSTGRLLIFLRASGRMSDHGDAAARRHVDSLVTDTNSLIEHSSFLADNLTFLLDASLGLISVEQNAAMKLFSWAALVFLPPTLVAGIYGMNFDHMPELHWLAGYPWALGLMFASAVIPLWVLKRRGWI